MASKEDMRKNKAIRKQSGKKRGKGKRVKTRNKSLFNFRTNIYRNKTGKQKAKVKAKQNKKNKTNVKNKKQNEKKQQKKKIITVRRRINKVRVLIALLILILLISVIVFVLKSMINVISNINPLKPKENQVFEAEVKSEEQTSEQRQTTEPEIEPSEDAGIKSLIESVITEKGLSEKSFAFFYYNMNTKKYYFYNENKYMTAASSIKMPIAMVYYDKVENGELTLEDTITYTKNSYEEGEGKTVVEYKIGSKIPISYLIEQSIVNSDNTATNILINNLGYKEYRKKIAEFSSVEVPSEFYSENITSAKLGYDIVKKLYENKDKYSQLIGFLKQSSHGSYLKKYLDVDVAHKFGSYEGYIHDYGIVFGKNDYLIGVYTKGVRNGEDFIAELSSEVYKFEETGESKYVSVKDIEEQTQTTESE